MKKILILSVLLIAVMVLIAESPKDEAMKSLDLAKQYLSQENYVKAQEEINFAQAKISEIQAEQLLTHFPDAVAGYKLEDKEAQGLGQAGAIVASANAVTATGNYSKGKSDIDLTITIGGVLGQAGNMMGLANMFGAMGMAGTGKTTVRVGSYTGNQEFDKSEGSGTLTIQVGPKTTVMITGSKLENADILKTFAEGLDLAKLEKSF